MILIKIIVIDYASDNGGAKRISQYFNEAILEDKANHWLFITSKFQPVVNRYVKNLQIKWIKKNLLYRLWFENRILPRIIQTYQPDVIISLQNLKVKKFKGTQVVYLHQSIPFIDYHLKSKFKGLASFKIKLLSYLIRKDVKSTDLILVQTEYMAEQVKKFNSKVLKVMPRLFNQPYTKEHKAKDFIYPTSAHAYKRFDLVEKTARIIKEAKMDMRILLTLDGNENDIIQQLKRQVQLEDLPINFIGFQDADALMQLYPTHNLLFTSEIESLGLPLIEAMHFGSKIFAYDIPVTREVLGSYPHQTLFKSQNLERKLHAFYEGMSKPSQGQDIEAGDVLKLLKSHQFIN